MQTMSVDDYVYHIAKKYRLATAIAVINSKPDNITLEEYVTTLKNKLNVENMDSDFDVSVSSGDFEFDGVNHDVNVGLVRTDGIDHVSDVIATNTETAIPDNNIDVNDKQVSDNKAIPFPENQSQCTYFEETQNNLSNNINNPLQQNDSQITYFEESQNILINEVVKDGPLNNASIKCDTRDATKEQVDYNRVYYINTNNLEETQIYTMPEVIGYYTHYSESQCDNIGPIGNKYIINNEKRNNVEKETNNSSFFNNFSQDMNLYFDQTQNMDFLFGENLNAMPQNNVICDSIDTNQNYVTTDAENHKVNHIIDEEDQRSSKNATDADNHTSVLNDVEVMNNDGNVELEEVKETNEAVPFKIIEELNRVKMYLRKWNEKSVTDSGYRSESQGKNFRCASQLSINCINQSATCLIEYVRTCPLLSATREIIKEISEILGSLVDKLHEEETYPPFIEILLETVDLSLRQISEEDGSSDNVLSTKDDIFQRILFINRSKNIQKYTINNITKYIENVSNQLHNKGTYEITNINVIENLCYILHILEIIITDYTKNSSLPTTQTSQDDCKLKKSSLSDVWRRKWNPGCKKTKQEGGGRERCVLDYLSEVLNKLTVNCMESYSLISYSALKCYNLLQTA